MRALLIVLLLWIPMAYAEGASFLGLCNPSWPCGLTLATWKDGPIVTGWLEESFGSRCNCANRILKDPRPKIIRVHLTNLTCVRGNRFCGRHEFMFGFTPRRMSKRLIAGNRRVIKRFGRPLHRFARRIAGVQNLQCYVSPSLESTLHDDARLKLLQITAAALPDCRLVDNIVAGHCLPGTICEKHGITPSPHQPCIADLDGVDGRQVDLNQYLIDSSHCIIRYYWEPRMNCISDKFILPNERACNLGRKFFNRIGAICRSLRVS